MTTYLNVIGAHLNVPHGGVVTAADELTLPLLNRQSNRWSTEPDQTTGSSTDLGMATS